MSATECINNTREVNSLVGQVKPFRRTAEKNIPLTDYLRRHPITYDDATETERENNEGDDTESEEEYVIHQINGLFNFNRTNGSITQHTGQPPPTQKINQSQSAHTHVNGTKTISLLKRVSPEPARPETS